MRYFHGFGFQKEQRLFAPWLRDNDYTVAGFSYGAQKAFDFLYDTPRRYDTLQLFSPAFFQNESNAFVRTQLHFFKRQNTVYMQQFYKNVASPSSLDLRSFYAEGSEAELSSLLHYRWEREKLQALLKRGVHIEVYLGEYDKIIDIEATRSFFEPYAEIYLIKGVGHLLRGA